jgi:arylsulfatase A-like enzyme
MPPNILLILTDQHRLSAVGAYGNTPCQTPHIDHLAAEGVQFDNAYTTCPVCSPARATIMTGQYPHTHGVTANIHELGCSVHELVDRPELLSRRLQAAGYSLGYTGKWHLGTDRQKAFDAPNQPSLPRDVGFEGHNVPGHGDGGFGMPEYQTYLKQHEFQHQPKPWGNDALQLRRAGELAGPEESTVAHFLTDHTISLIDSFARRDRPFFIWHNFWGPHEPYYAPTRFVDLYHDEDIPPWPNYDWPARCIPGFHHVKLHPRQEQLRWQDWAAAVRYYYALASLIDSQIGRLLDHLEQTGLIENTVIIFAADHGETLGSHGGLVDKGWHHFEETHHIPFIMRFPNGSHRGTSVSQLVSLADLYPTILDIADGSWKSDRIHGQSLLSLLNNNTASWRDMLVTEFGGLGNLAVTQRTLRWNNLKYGYNAGMQDEIYDLERDPHETRNLIEHPGYRSAASQLRERLAQWMRDTNDPAERMFRLAMSYYDNGDGLLIYTGSGS